MPDDWADRWADFHRPIEVAGRIGVRPSWWDPQDGLIDVVVDPGRAFGTGGHPTTRLCLALLVELEEAGEASGPIADWGTGSGVLAIAAAKLGWVPVMGCDREEASLETARGQCGGERRRAGARARRRPRERRRRWRPTRGREPDRQPAPGLRRPPGGCRRSCPAALVCSGMLESEIDEVAAAFAPSGSRESRRLTEHEWGALLLRRGAGGLMAPEPSSELPIAMFDSGVGGLTVLHECLVSLPEEDYVYLGDDARFPYGRAATDELREHVEQVSRFLLDRGAKLLVIACNSAASAGQEAAREIAAEAGIEVVAVIEPEAEIAARPQPDAARSACSRPRPPCGAAPTCARSPRQQRSLTVTEVEAPDLAAVIQRGFPFDESVVEMVRSYCEPLKRAEVDTVILGCTHYPLVAPMLQRVLGPGRAAWSPPATRSRRPRSGSWRRRGSRKPAMKRGPTGSSAPGTPSPSASWGPASCRCRWARSSGWSSRGRIVGTFPALSGKPSTNLRRWRP